MYLRAIEVAAAENIPVDDLFAVAFEERMLELERLKEKASRGSYEKFLRVMSKVPVAEARNTTASNTAVIRAAMAWPKMALFFRAAAV